MSRPSFYNNGRGYGPDFTAARIADQAAREQELADLQQANQEARTTRLQAQRAARLAEIEQWETQLEERLAGQKATQRREWLIAHPEFGGDYFDQQVWPLLREQLAPDEIAGIQQARTRISESFVRAGLDG